MSSETATLGFFDGRSNFGGTIVHQRCEQLRLLACFGLLWVVRIEKPEEQRPLFAGSEKFIGHDLSFLGSAGWGGGGSSFILPSTAFVTELHNAEAGHSCFQGVAFIADLFAANEALRCSDLGFVVSPSLVRGRNLAAAWAVTRLSAAHAASCSSRRCQISRG
jgi:hypothetical protein